MLASCFNTGTQCIGKQRILLRAILPLLFGVICNLERCQIDTVVV